MSALASATPRILLVIEDTAEARRISGIFSEIAPDRPLQVAPTAEEGLNLLKDGDHEALFVELSAGGRAGTQFLQEAWKIRPRAVRFLVADSLEPALIVECAIGSHHFLPKPLGPDNLRGALERADSINRLIRNERIQALVSKMRTLPSRPSLYLEVMRELRSPDASAQTVGESIAKDLAISAKVIQVVNSAYYGLQQQVTDPAAAVLLLGLETTASLVLSIEAMARFDKVKPLYFSVDRVWRHCQTVAHSARGIAELLSNDPEVARHAFTSGLLHDIGKLALALNFEDQYHGALKLAEKNKLPACEVEFDVFGANHAEAGAYLLSLWGLPMPVVDAVASHHVRARDVDKSFSAAVALHLAERLEYEQDCEKNGTQGMTIDLDYPDELQLKGRLEELRAIVRRDQRPTQEKPAAQDSSEGTMIFTRAQLKADPAPLPASGAPAPLISVSEPHPIRSKRPMYIALGSLALVLALVLSWAFQTQKKTTHLAQASAARKNPAAENRDLSNILGETADKPVAKPEPVPVRDPEPGSDLKLQAILYNGQNSSLVINGRSLRLGDLIEGSKIVAIDHNSVTIENLTGKRKLTLATRHN